MSEHPHSPAFEQLRVQLDAAAQRELGIHEPTPHRSRFPRHHRRLVLAVGLLVLMAATLAVATDLISTGDDVRDEPGRPSRYKPGPHGSVIVSTAPDPEGGVLWGVAVYRAADGESCAIAGQVNGGRIGLVEAGQFRPYERTTAGLCGDLTKQPITSDLRQFGNVDGQRTVVYGRVRPMINRVVATQGGQTDRASTHRGAYLFVYKGKLSPSQVSVVVARRGR